MGAVTAADVIAEGWVWAVADMTAEAMAVEVMDVEVMAAEEGSGESSCGASARSTVAGSSASKIMMPPIVRIHREKTGPGPAAGTEPGMGEYPAGRQPEHSAGDSGVPGSEAANASRAGGLGRLIME